MTRIRILTRLILVPLLLVMGMTLYGQNGIDFYYKCRNDIKKPFKSTILLKLPTKKTYTLFSDTISEYNISTQHFFAIKGKYSLVVSIEADKYGADSINYDFELNGKETITAITVSFDYNERFNKKRNTFEKGEKVVNGYVCINKHYEAPKSVEISFDESIKPDVLYDGPFFKIKNNSKDTIYGTYLPGYFWGTLSYLKNDSVLSTREGTIDVLFADSPPLYPDSTKIATVGSFGFRTFRKPDIIDYKFEVWYKKKRQANGIDAVLEERKNFKWVAETMEYYKLKCVFNVDKKTPNR